MAFSNVQNGLVTAGSAGSVTLPFPANTTAKNLLIAVLTSNQGGSSFSGPAGWSRAIGVSQGTLNRTEIWYYPNNPGSISSATFTISSGVPKGQVSEFSSATGSTQVLDQTGTNNGTTGTSYPVTAGGSNFADDLGISMFANILSGTPTGQLWTTPSGWTLLKNVPNSTINWASYYQANLSAGTLAVTGTYSTSTNETAWTGALATFTEVLLPVAAVTATASIGAAPTDIENPSAAVHATASLGATGAEIAPGTAAVSAAASIGAAGRVTRLESAAVNTTASVGAAPTVTRLEHVAITATAAISATGVKGRTGSAAVAAIASVGAAGQVTRLENAAVHAVAAISVTAMAVRFPHGSVSASAAVGAAPVVTRLKTATVHATATVGAVPLIAHHGAATIVAVARIAAGAPRQGTASIHAVASLSATAAHAAAMWEVSARIRLMRLDSELAVTGHRSAVVVPRRLSATVVVK